MLAETVRGFQLSLQQKRLWSLQQNSTAYHAFCRIRIEGELDPAVFHWTLRKIAARHIILRTKLYRLPGMDMPVQVITNQEAPATFWVNLERIQPAEQARQIAHCSKRMREQRLDLEQSPSFRCVLWRLSPLEHILLIHLPAFFADAATLQNLLTEITQTYAAHAHGTDALADPLQYIEFSAWQDELLQDEDSRDQRAFWQKVNVPPPDTMPVPFERRGQTSPVGLSETFFPQSVEIPGQERWSRQLQAVARQVGVSLEAFLLVCWQYVIWRLTSQSPVWVGVEYDGRYYEELAAIAGLCSKVIPISNSFNEKSSFERVLVLAHASLEEARKRQTYFLWEPFPPETAAGQEAGFVPLSFAYEEWAEHIHAAGLLFSPEQSVSCIEPFAIKLHVLRIGQRLQLRLFFDPQRLSHSHMQSMAKCLNTLLLEAAAHLTTPVKDLPILSAEDQLALRRRFSAPSPSLPFQTLVQAFEAQVERHPNHAAVMCEGRVLTYDQLNRQANRLARTLKAAGAGPNVPVGLYVERSISMVVGMLAILKAGGAYVPFDPAQPQARLTHQLQDLHLSIMTTQAHLSAHLSSVWSGRVFFLDEPDTWGQQLPDHNLSEPIHADDLAYVMYTSGSTGVPKGVMIRHGGVINYTSALCNMLAVQPGLHFATVSTLAADLGNTSIFCALASSGCLHIISYVTATSGEAFAQYIAHHPLDVLKIVPSHLSALLASCARRTILPRKALLLGGEALPYKLLHQLSMQKSTCLVLNHYGPTETTIGALVNRLGTPENLTSVPNEAASDAVTVPIGQPIAGMEAYILDQFQHILPVGVQGELYLGGKGLAAAYWHQPEQTQERFVAHPWSTGEGARLYRTGDLAMYREDGTIEFIGRADTQVKLRGYRIELGEIEAVLSQHPHVRESAVLLREVRPGDQRLVAYIVARQPAPGEEDLRSFLASYLPDYMLPTTFVFLRALPLNINGKLNRHLLPPPGGEETPRKTFVEPRNPIEEILAGIWESVLKIERVGIYDNFASLGGHSLLATQVISRIRQVLHIDVPLRALFEAPTVAGLSERIAQIQNEEQDRKMPPLVPTPRTEPLPLSFAQQRLWFLDQLRPGSIAYLIPRARLLRGALHIAALERSLSDVIRRHEILRTTFQEAEGQPVQTIHPPQLFCLPIVDLCGLADGERNKIAQQLATQENHLPCNLSQGSLLRSCLLRIGAHEHVWLLTMHHIISDAWSRNILFKELSIAYNAHLEGKMFPLPALSIQYADFAVWQRNWLQGSVLQAELDYWTRHLQDIPRVDFPADRPRPVMQTFHGAQCIQILPAALNKQIKQLSQREGTTLFMTLLAAFQVLLACYTGQRDITVGTPIANRGVAEIEELIGFFTNTLVMRTDLSGNPSFRDVLQRVREVALEAYAHQDVPFETLVEALPSVRDLSHSPLFQILFVLQHASPATEPFKALALEAFPLENTTAKFDFTLSVTDMDQGLRCSIEYNTDLFDERTIASLLDHWHILLTLVTNNPQQRLDDLSLLTEAEHRRIVTEWNTPSLTAHSTTCVHHLFEQQVSRTPDSVAVVNDDEHLTYAVLNRQANQLAHHLQSLGMRPDTAVGLCVERSLKLAVGVLGILKAGGAYLSLDPSYPAERLAFMLKNARVPVLLTQTSLRERIPIHGEERICLDSAWQVIARECENNLDIELSGENLTYIIYTSGSTGTPKGMGLPHLALVNLLLWHFSELTVAARTLQFASLSFDASFYEFFITWGTGGTLVFPAETLRHNIGNLTRFLSFMAIEKAIFPVTVLQQVAEEACRQQQSTGHLREIISTGEQLQINAPLRDFFMAAAAHNCTLHNHYGPSESHVVTAYTLPENPSAWATHPPIGRPITNTQIYLLDQHANLLPIGVPGEVYIGGVCLARGYLNQPAMTAERFVPHPFSSVPGARLYRTGDLARYLPDGTIEYLGRLDHQVKVQGYRIELGEIESVLSKHTGIKEVVVTAREDTPGDKRLMAYLVIDRANIPTGSALRAYLRERLPDYMIPSAFVEMDALPLTSNGKVNLQALPHPEGHLLEHTTEYLPPQTEIERLIAAIWQKLLYAEKIGLHDNFFDLGGYSLLAIRVHREIQEALGREVALVDLFKYPTVSSLAQSLSSVKAEQLALKNIDERADRRRETARRQQEMRKLNRRSH